MESQVSKIYRKVIDLRNRRISRCARTASADRNLGKGLSSGLPGFRALDQAGSVLRESLANRESLTPDEAAQWQQLLDAAKD